MCDIQRKSKYYWDKNNKKYRQTHSSFTAKYIAGIIGPNRINVAAINNLGFFGMKKRSSILSFHSSTISSFEMRLKRGVESNPISNHKARNILKYITY
jgi:hypothetical protein